MSRCSPPTSSCRAQLEQVVRRLTDPEHPIDMLVNNAGFGLPLSFERNDIDDEVRHLRAARRGADAAHARRARADAQRGSGRIVNIASVAGFIPRSTYGACKGWLISFSRWANGRYVRSRRDGHGRVPGLHPHELPRADGAAARRRRASPAWMWLDARDVVAEALRDVARGKAVSVPSLRYKAIVALTPHRAGRALVARAGERRRR